MVEWCGRKRVPAFDLAESADALRLGGTHVGKLVRSSAVGLRDGIGWAAIALILVGCASGGGTSANETATMRSGYTCCNLRSNGSWISDSNYAEPGKSVIPLGSPVTVTGFGRNRVNLRFSDGSQQQLGNDYSRSQALPDFAAKYVVASDPHARLVTFPAKIQSAIKGGRLVLGMTKEQVLMSLGYPIADENPNLDAPYWRYWRTSFAEFRVLWDDKGRLRQVETHPDTRTLIMEP